MIWCFYWFGNFFSTKIEEKKFWSIYFKANQVIEINMKDSKSIKTFVLIQKIGEVNYSEVYKCLDSTDGNYYALKFSKFLNGEASFYEENPSNYFVKYYGIGCIDINGKKYGVIVLELGSFTVKDYIKKISLIRTEILIIIKQVLDGLRFIHSKNYVYGNLSFNKLLVTDSFKVKFLGIDLYLLNLGLLKIFDSKQNDYETTNCVYNAPEIRNGSSYTSKTDIWCLGSLIYYIFTKTRYLGSMNSNGFDNETIDFLSFFLNEDPNSHPRIDYLFLNSYFDEFFIFLDIFDKLPNFNFEINCLFKILKNDNLITVEKNELKFYILEIISDKLSSCDGLIRLFLYYYSNNVEFCKELSKPYRFSRYINFFVGFDLESLHSVTQLDFTSIKILEQIFDCMSLQFSVGEIHVYNDFDLNYIKKTLNYYPV